MKKDFYFFDFFTTNNLLSASNQSDTVYAHVNGLVCDFCARALENNQ